MNDALQPAHQTSPAPPDAHRLQVRELFCERDERLLFEALSFSLAGGQALQIGGGNGVGKSTLLRMLAGLYDDFQGTIEWTLDRPPLYLGHKPGVRNDLSAAENLAWLMRLQGQRPLSGLINAALDQVGLGAFAQVLCGSLSEGQRKRVNLARLYVIDSRAWLLDEPFSAIDSAGIAQLETRMQAHLDGGGLLVLTSHQPVSFTVPPASLVLGS